MIDSTRPLTRREASTYLFERYGIKRSPNTLAKYAVIGGGPTYRKAGCAALYQSTDLDEWAAEITSQPVRSTSELVEAM